MEARTRRASASINSAIALGLTGGRYQRFFSISRGAARLSQSLVFSRLLDRCDRFGRALRGEPHRGWACRALPSPPLSLLCHRARSTVNARSTAGILDGDVSETPRTARQEGVCESKAAPGAFSGLPAQPFLEQVVVGGLRRCQIHRIRSECSKGGSATASRPQETPRSRYHPRRAAIPSTPVPSA